MTAAGAVGWVLATGMLAWALLLRARLQAVARADHELRGPVTALALAGAGLARTPGMRDRGVAIEGQVERLRAGLADLAAARRLGLGGRATRARRAHAAPALPLEDAVRAAAAGWEPVAAALGRRVAVEWEAGSAAAAIGLGRLAQAVGNLLANALEHGHGDVTVCGHAAGDVIAIEVLDGARADRGHGLAIAARAAERAGGRVTFERDAAGARASIELPLVS